MASPMTLLEVDPKKLQLHPANVRKKHEGIDELAASIADIGVQVPLIVRPNGSDDSFIVVAGARRTLAAVKAGVEKVPVLVCGEGESMEPVVEGVRRCDLTTMLVENLHRQDLTPADEAAGYEQLAAFGVSAAEISKLTGRATERVEAGIKVAKSAATVAVAVKHPLSFDQLVAIAEFDAKPKTVERLVKTAERDPRSFEYEVESMRRVAVREAERAVKRDELTANGITVIAAKTFGWSANSKNCRLDELVDDKGKAITTAGHKKCPGHAAAVDEWCNVVYGCTDPKANGHKPKRPNGAGTFESGRTPAQKAQAEADKMERAALKDACDIATTVRRKWIKELLTRKTPPAGTLAFVVPAILSGDLYANDWNVVTALTGTPKPPAGKGYQAPITVFEAMANGANETRLQMVLLAFVCAAIDEDFSDNYRFDELLEGEELAARYLQFLASCGYGLSEIEQRIVTAAFPDKPKGKKK